MKRLSVTLMSGEDLERLEEHANELLANLLESKPFGLPFTEYKGPVRISMSFNGEAGKDSLEYKTLRFVVDFPSKFEYYHGDPYSPNSVVVFLHTIEGLHATSVSTIVMNKIARALMANPIWNIRLGHEGLSISQNGKKEEDVYWLRMPKE